MFREENRLVDTFKNKWHNMKSIDKFSGSGCGVLGNEEGWTDFTYKIKSKSSKMIPAIIKMPIIYLPLYRSPFLERNIFGIVLILTLWLSCKKYELVTLHPVLLMYECHRNWSRKLLNFTDCDMSLKVKRWCFSVHFNIVSVVTLTLFIPSF